MLRVCRVRSVMADKHVRVGLMQLTVAWLVDDGEKSYPAPRPIQFSMHLLTEAEFLALLDQVREHLNMLQKQLEKDDARGD